MDCSKCFDNILREENFCLGKQYLKIYSAQDLLFAYIYDITVWVQSKKMLLFQNFSLLSKYFFVQKLSPYFDNIFFEVLTSY